MTAKRSDVIVDESIARRIRMKKTINLLIIDDDNIIRRSLGRMLGNNEALHVFQASDRESTFRILNETAVHCILMDYYMADITGLEMMRLLREQNRDIPVVMLTGQGDEQLAASIIKAGAYDYISKKSLSDPDTAATLTYIILNAISHHAENRERERSRVALELSEARYRGLIDNSPILILRFSPEDHMISFINDSFCKYFNVDRSRILGENILQFLPEENHRTFNSHVDAITGDDPVTSFEIITGEEKQRKWQIWTVQGIFSDDGIIAEYQCMGEDITALKETQQQFIRQKRYLQSILDSQENMTLVADEKNIHEVNISFLHFFGFRSPEDMQQNFQRVIDMTVPTDGYLQPEDGRTMWLSGASGGTDGTGRYRLIAFRSGSDRLKIFSVKYSPLTIDSDIFVIEFSDVTELEEQSREFENRASYDQLTKIFNRRKFLELLEKEKTNSMRLKHELALVFFDIDHFKHINDTYGHQAGDDVLRELTALVSRGIRCTDIFARWGGEEFLILLSGMSLDMAMRLAEKLRHSIMTYEFTGVKKVTCSFGVTLYREGEDVEAFVNRADGGLYRAKESGRNRVVGIRKKDESSAGI